MNEDFTEVTPYTPASNTIESIKGETALIRTDTGYQTAVAVAKQRDLDNIIKNVLVEAQIGKNDFWYTWQVRNNKTNELEWIPPGGTIGLAQAMYRAWGNCALDTKVTEENGEWIFKSVFIDIEKGTTLTRELRKKIPLSGNGKYDTERWRNMQFQIAQSKNQRDVILNGLPRWLKQKAIEAAIEASKIKEPEHDGKLTKAISFFASHGVTEKELCIYFNHKSSKDFTLDDIAKLRNLANQLVNKEITADDIKKQAKDIFDYDNAIEDKPKPTSSKKESKNKTELNGSKKDNTEATNTGKKEPESMATQKESEEEPLVEEDKTATLMIKMYQSKIKDVIRKTPAIYKKCCDELFMPTDILPDTIESCEIVLNKIEEIRKNGK